MQLSLSLREKHDKIVFTLQGYFARSDSLFSSPCIFLQILDNPRPTLNHAICSVYSPNVLEARTMLRILFSSFCVFFILPFLSVLALDSKGIINTLKRYYVAWNALTLQVDFTMPEATVMNLFAFASISCGSRQMK